MASLVIGITGKKRAGKDSFAARLVDRHGFTRLAFADALKGAMVELDPLLPVHPDETGAVWGPGSPTPPGTYRLSEVVAAAGWERAKEIREVRRLLQAHGVSIRRHVDPGVWVDVVRRRAAEIRGPVVITDVRFPNEAEYVQGVAHGRLIRVERPSLRGAVDTHVSETALNGWPVDARVANDGTLDALYTQADRIVTLWRDTGH